MCCLSHHKGSFQPSARLQLPSSRYSSPKLGPWKTSCPGCQHYSLLQQLTLAEATSSPSHALGFGVRRKLISNLPACHLAGVDFIPIVVETLGGWCPDAISTIRLIGRALGQRLNSTNTVDTTKHLFGRLAIALWRGNAGLWMHRHPTLPLSIDGLV